MKHFLSQIITVFCILSATIAQSAEISFKIDTSTGCTIQLTGLIVDGDAENLKKIYSENITSNSSITSNTRNGSIVNSKYNTVGARICLDSSGGSLLEAFKIFDYLRNGTENAMTYIPKEARCESACAIVFLAGGNGYYGSSPARAMHPTARLGFHAPDLVIPDGNYNKVEVSKAYALALETVSRLLNLRREKPLADRTMLPNSVLEIMLSTPPDEMYYVETVGQAAQWGISIFPIKPPENFGKLNWLAGCINTASMINDTPPDYDPMEIDWGASNEESERVLPTLPENGPPFVFGMGEGSECKIDSGNSPLALRFSEVSIQQEVKDVITFYPEYLFYGANTKIIDLPATKEILSENFSDRFSYLRSDSAKACEVSRSETKITNVENFTNFRRQAGLNGQVIGQVPLGATVSVVNPGQFLRYDRCAAACNGTNQNAINQCIDNNDVWIEVQYNGRRGFLSRKFLE